MAESDPRDITEDREEMSDVPDADVRWIPAPEPRSAEEERCCARRAWETIAPADGQLPDHPTPLHLLLYTRMITSNFIATMANRVTGATPTNPVTGPSGPHSSEIMRQSRVPAS
jgi:hypothetical protein